MTTESTTVDGEKSTELVSESDRAEGLAEVAGSARYDGEGTAPQRTRWQDLIRPGGYFVLSRVGVIFAALVAKWIFPTLNVPNALGQGWDGYWYVKIAQHWYPHHLVNEMGGSRWAFFPGLPALIRLVVSVTGLSYANAAIVVTSVFGLASAVAVFLAVREVFGTTIANRTVLLYVFFPTSYVLSMAYSEGLFVTLAALCLFALSRKSFVIAGLCAVAASLTRNFGVVLVVCVAAVAIPAILEGKERVRALIGLLISPVGFVGWLIYSWREAGTPLAFMKGEAYWGSAHFIWFKAPFQSLGAMFTGVHAFYRADEVLAALALLFMLAGLAVLAWAQLKKVPVPIFWWVFAVGMALGAMSPFWPNSVLRYSMVLIPCLAAFAWLIRSSWIGAIVGALAVSEGALAVIILVGLAHPQSTLLAP
jgi:hypothetical protein